MPFKSYTLDTQGIRGVPPHLVYRLYHIIRAMFIESNYAIT